MNNKIEKGCLAIVVNSYCPENLGKVVTVGNFIGAKDWLEGDDVWEVDVAQMTTSGEEVYSQRECNLLRIDSYDQDMYNDEQIEQLEKERME